MGGRPWLEALKEHSDQKGWGRGAILTDALGSEPTKPTKATEVTSVGAPLRPVTDIRTVRTPRKEDELCQLLAADWKPKERCGKTIWERPDNGFYVSEEMALHILNQGKGGAP